MAELKLTYPGAPTNVENVDVMESHHLASIENLTGYLASARSLDQPAMLHYPEGLASTLLGRAIVNPYYIHTGFWLPPLAIGVRMHALLAGEISVEIDDTDPPVWGGRVTTIQTPWTGAASTLFRRSNAVWQSTIPYSDVGPVPNGQFDDRIASDTAWRLFHARIEIAVLSLLGVSDYLDGALWAIQFEPLFAV